MDCHTLFLGVGKRLKNYPKLSKYIPERTCTDFQKTSQFDRFVVRSEIAPKPNIASAGLCKGCCNQCCMSCVWHAASYKVDIDSNKLPLFSFFFFLAFTLRNLYTMVCIFYSEIIKYTIYCFHRTTFHKLINGNRYGNVPPQPP